MRVGWSSVRAAGYSTTGLIIVGLLFFNYHNDARSNKHQIHCHISYLNNCTVHLLLFCTVTKQCTIN